MGTTTTSLALLEHKPDRARKPTKKDKDIYLLSRRGWTLDALSTHYHLKPTTIKASIDRYQLYRDSLGNDEIDLSLNELASRVMPKVEKVLTEAMKADHVVNVGRGRQVIMKKVADHATRLKSVEMVKSIMEISRPKGGGININTQVNNGRGEGGGTAAPRGFDFEARLRDIRASKGITDGSAVIDAEFEDEEKDELADELAEMGIELEPEEDDEEEQDGEDDGDEE